MNTDPLQAENLKKLEKDIKERIDEAFLTAEHSAPPKLLDLQEYC